MPRWFFLVAVLGFVGFLAFLSAAALLDSRHPADRPPPTTGFLDDARWLEVHILTDRDTECRYLVISHTGTNGRTLAITPRLAGDGKPDCPGP